MDASSYLVRVSYQPRVWSSLLACMLLGYLGSGSALWLLVTILLVLLYPHALQWLLVQWLDSKRGARLALLVDAAVVGILMGLVSFEPAVCLALMALVLVSAIIVDGARLIVGVLVSAGLTAVPMGALNADVAAFQESPVLVALIAYFCFVAWLVYDETYGLKVGLNTETRFRQGLSRVNQSLKPYVAPQVVHMRQEPPQTRRRLTVFFSDIEGFTRLMDTADESLVAEFLNEYFGCMNQIAAVHGGTVDKFIGDGVMVFFGDPDSRGPAEDAYACVAMAMEMRDRFGHLDDCWRRRIRHLPLHIRVGIHTGYCLVGSFGSDERKEYTALGSTVNRASRLEGKAARNEILISEATYRLVCRWVEVEDRGLVQLKGVSEPIQTYSISKLYRRRKTASPGSKIMTKPPVSEQAGS